MLCSSTNSRKSQESGKPLPYDKDNLEKKFIRGLKSLYIGFHESSFRDLQERLSRIVKVKIIERSSRN